MLPFLRGILDGSEKPLKQGLDAVSAAGLTTMSMGIGANGGFEQMHDPANARRGKKKQGKRRRKTAKDEV